MSSTISIYPLTAEFIEATCFEEPEKYLYNDNLHVLDNLKDLVIIESDKQIG